MASHIGRRKFLATLGGGAAAWPLAARAQQQAMPVIGFINATSARAAPHWVAAFRRGLGETGYIEGRNAVVEYHWLDGRYDRLPAVVADLVSRRVAVIATPGATTPAVVAKAATATIPIVFGVGDDPVKLGLVDNFARPGHNATGINFLVNEAVPKRLALLRDLVPSAVRIAAIMNPANAATAEDTLREVHRAAAAFGLQIQIMRERAEALFVAPDAFLSSRRVQFAILAARDRIPASYSQRDYPEAGGLMSYGTDVADSFREVGVYVGKILNGAKPADLPVTQSTKFELVINLQTAKALGLEVPSGLLLAADEVIE
jgi:putative tryptophan/tyrosine transport system substrate-binding protein